MKWNEVRNQFPNQCVLVESIHAKSEGNERIIEEMSVIDDFDNGNNTWSVYKKNLTENRSRELYIFHTKNEEIKVIEQPYIGVKTYGRTLFESEIHHKLKEAELEAKTTDERYSHEEVFSDLRERLAIENESG